MASDPPTRHRVDGRAIGQRTRSIGRCDESALAEKQPRNLDARHLASAAQSLGQQLDIRPKLTDEIACGTQGLHKLDVGCVEASDAALQARLVSLAKNPRLHCDAPRPPSATLLAQAVRKAQHYRRHRETAMPASRDSEVYQQRAAAWRERARLLAEAQTAPAIFCASIAADYELLARTLEERERRLEAGKPRAPPLGRVGRMWLKALLGSPFGTANLPGGGPTTHIRPDE